MSLALCILRLHHRDANVSSRSGVFLKGRDVLEESEVGSSSVMLNIGKVMTKQLSAFSQSEIPRHGRTMTCAADVGSECELLNRQCELLLFEDPHLKR
jgi:hypothetical protein